MPRFDWRPLVLPGGRLADYLRSRGLPVPDAPLGPVRVPVELELAPGESATPLVPANR
jgi:hypothetical protein